MSADEVAGLRQLFDAGDTAFGGWCVIPSAFSAEVLAQRGFDWVALDWQHGFIDLEKSANMIQAISLGGAAPFVRVTANEPWIIMKALDLGAFGVIVPLVNNRAEAERAVAAARYPPSGMRSFGPLMNAPEIGTHAGPASGRVLCFVMVETLEGYENIEPIAQTPGLDGVFIGPDDLRLSTVGPDGKLEATAVDHIREACVRCGILPGIHAESGEAAHAAAAAGFRIVAIASDADLLATSAAVEIERARGGPASRERDAERVVRAVVWSGL
jgi:4-hydroxy-2-oxoheptanedioate aldolase